MTRDEHATSVGLQNKIDHNATPCDGDRVLFIHRAPRIGRDPVAIGVEGTVTSYRRDMFGPRYSVGVTLSDGSTVLTSADNVRVLRG